MLAVSLSRSRWPGKRVLAKFQYDRLLDLSAVLPPLLVRNLALRLQYCTMMLAGVRSMVFITINT